MDIVIVPYPRCCRLNNDESLVPDTIFSATAKRLDSDIVYTRREVSHSVWAGTCEIYRTDMSLRRRHTLSYNVQACMHNNYT